MSATIYWFVLKIYAGILAVASLFNQKAKLFLSGRKDLLSLIRYALINEKRPRIWIHCASLGEFEQGRPIIEKLQADYPGFAIVLTFFSPSGYEVRKNYNGADYIFYLPLDSPNNAKRFVDIVQPRLCLFVKYEFWYFYLYEIAKRNIPLVLVSGIFRENQPFFKWYGRLHRRMLGFFSHLFVQDAASAQLLLRSGIDAITVAGDTRFDRVLEIAEQHTILPTAEEFCKDHRIIIAGSTWPEDEQLLKEAFDRLPETWKLVVAPHDVSESRITSVEQLFAGQTERWTNKNNSHNKRVLIIDKIGLLAQLYRYANIAWIGGGLRSSGLHNTLEAAVYGIPVAFGPNYAKFNEAKELLACGAAISTDNAAVLVRQITAWENDREAYHHTCESAGNYVRLHAGATNKITAYLAEKNWLSM
jgi:3-deoxy-D-manno-octulosonic-acid transferase